MTCDPIPVLWLCGPPGVGKTAAGWEIYRQLARAGVAAGYADIDQLGMCYPEPPADPGRHRLKARNLGAVLATFRAAGARCAVVSGVVDSDRGVPAGLLPPVTLTLCRLRAGRDEVARRFTGRGGDPAALPGVLRDADDMDASDVAGVCVDTSGLPVTEVARLARKRSGGWPVFPYGEPGELPGSGVLPRPAEPGRAGPESAGGHPPDAGELVPGNGGGQVLLVCGPTGVGKSAVGFETYLRDLRAGRTVAYIDADQLGFVHPAPVSDPANHRVKSRNAAALWRAYRAVGAQYLVMTGLVMTGLAGDGAVVRAYAEALAPAAMTVCRLHAGRAELTRRIMLRGQGKSWPQPGDPLLGQPAWVLRRVATEAAAAAQALERAGNTLQPAGNTLRPAATHVVRIGTDARTVAQAADDVIARTGGLSWHAGRHPPDDDCWRDRPVQPVSPPWPAFAPAPVRGRAFRTTRTVRSTDVSPGGRLRLDAVARYLQEAAEDDITDAGWTPPYGWLLRRCAITVRSYPSRGDVVRLCTFCSGTGQRWAERTTTLAGPAGEVMQARAIWVAIDRTSGEPVPLGPGFGRIYGESARGHRVSARLSLPAPDGVGGGRDWPLRASDFDTAGHVNNTIHWIAVEEALAEVGALAEVVGRTETRGRAEAAGRTETRGPMETRGPTETRGEADTRGEAEAGAWAEAGARAEARIPAGSVVRADEEMRAGVAVPTDAPWLPGFAELEYHRPMLPGLLPRLLASHEPGQVMVWLLDGGERLASARLSSTPPDGRARPAKGPRPASGRAQRSPRLPDE